MTTRKSNSGKRKREADAGVKLDGRSLTSAEQAAYKRGVLDAAALADEYKTNHPSRLGDCIAMKLNACDRRRPRPNKERLQDPWAAAVRASAEILASVLIYAPSTKDVAEAICKAAKIHYVTIGRMAKHGVNRTTIDVLRRAGVP